ncbi:Lysine decarboxylase 2, constitutive [Klebsiella pneumoniae]|uniref:Lysine decarboxylase 2, constitutive n=1 Tax=Klebsiella pneumoniae TaxID=573 RepID=A0A377WCU2_KLEPN|nr:Lysine decarboxylase 2, constitutive [Klebsiella pneumoniae]
MTLWFFEYALGLSEEIATALGSTPASTWRISLRVYPRAVQLCPGGKIYLLYAGSYGGSAYQKSPVGCLFYDFFGGNTLKADVSISVTELAPCWIIPARTWRRRSISRAPLAPSKAIW